MCDHTRGHTKPTRSQARVVEDGFSCRWTGCDKICRSKATRAQNAQRNHARVCLPQVQYNLQGKEQSDKPHKSLRRSPQRSMFGLLKECVCIKHGETQETNCRNAPINRNNETTIIRTREYKQCDKCGAWITKSNLARHKNVSCTGNTRQGSI